MKITTADGRTIPRFHYGPVGRQWYALPRIRKHSSEHVTVLRISIGNRSVAIRWPNAK